ncbi:MAG: hypothetical protein KAH20_15150, partial [Methylococcales bacterium]|nr:hypothetical protein [Methylococcales bacterium]
VAKMARQFISVNQIATLKMPQGSQPIGIQSSTQCLYAAGCYETTLVSNSGAVQFQMLSSPFEDLALTHKVNSSSVE